MNQGVVPSTSGRRARGMQEKRDRIFRAARGLFAERGFEAVTTQEISDLADVAAGTLFRYATSKSELLLMVYNEEFRAAIVQGEQGSAAVEDVNGAVHALLLPTLNGSQRMPENAVAYQRELLFGAPSEKYRAEGLELVQRLEAVIAARLVAAAPQRSALWIERARQASRSIFAVLHLAIATRSTGLPVVPSASKELRPQVDQIIAGFLAGEPVDLDGRDRVER